MHPAVQCRVSSKPRDGVSLLGAASVRNPRSRRRSRLPHTRPIDRTTTHTTRRSQPPPLSPKPQGTRTCSPGPQMPLGRMATAAHASTALLLLASTYASARALDSLYASFHSVPPPAANSVRNGAVTSPGYGRDSSPPRMSSPLNTTPVDEASTKLRTPAAAAASHTRAVPTMFTACRAAAPYARGRL